MHLVDTITGGFMVKMLMALNVNYTRREAIKRFRETYDCVGKRNVIEAVIPQFGWY